ncbi:MAG: quercetin 2,3-dioxygenase [Betaproteobacteria bacterium HGW-Betaproteobacteria-2]|nr:MAG: quercetin 2,3-dioxygenase [Betaproteobacteria bacterium HGW-Betaproteobacteria-2]
MIKLRKSAERGHANHGWLDSYHSFSFNRYYDPAHMQYSVLRVINEDVVAPDRGFGMHPHQDMEIVTYMLSGALRHMDSLGNGSVIRTGDVQRMTAGSGIVHSEVNASSSEPAHLLQIWMLPERSGLEPGYEEKHFPAEEKLNRLRLIASRDAREGSLLVHQDVSLYASVLQQGKTLSYTLGEDRSAYLQLARGRLDLNGEILLAGDAAKLEQVGQVSLLAEEDAEFLLFDMPSAD